MDNSELINYFADGQWHSGVEIAELLGVSRAAIWKRLQKLESIGLKIEREQSKGYRLGYRFRPLQPRQFDALPFPVSVRTITESTNTDAQQWVAEKGGQWPENFCAVTAEQQTAGRGRRGRQWLSPYGANLYLSCAAELPVGAAALEQLSLQVGIVLAQVLDKAGLPDVKVKWPNDIYVQGKKLAGILIEVNGDLQSQCNLVIGTGVNFTLASLHADEVLQPFAAVDQYADVSREAVAIELISGIYRLLDDIVQGGGDNLMDRWQDFDYLAGEKVDLHLGAQVISGKALGIDPNGNLRIEQEDGAVRSFAGGEVSVRIQS